MRQEDIEHLVRTGIIVALFLATGATWIWAPLNEEMKLYVGGLVSVLGVGLLDSLRLARKQKVERTRRLSDLPPPLEEPAKEPEPAEADKDAEKTPITPPQTPKPKLPK